MLAPAEVSWQTDVLVYGLLLRPRGLASLEQG